MRWLLLSFLLIACKNHSEVNKAENDTNQFQSLKVEYAKGFTIDTINQGYILNITKPWPDANETFKYLLYKDKSAITESKNYDYSIKIPLNKLVVTSTTHIPSLDTLGVLDRLIGFPNTDYVSTKRAVDLIKKDRIKDVGQNENLNTELLIELDPDAIVTFAVKGQNRSIESIKKSGIPVLYNGDWVESHALGKAEWIKFFGLLFDKADEATAIFEGIKNEYESAKAIAQKAKNQPTVISGALWKDTWYLPAGDSWQSQILADANANYLYSKTEGTGSLSLSFESVFSKSKDATFWIAPAQYTSYNQMYDQHSHYGGFKAFKDKNIYTFALTKGQNGGVLYYELAPNRPDLVLKDLIHILHPNLLPDYNPFFFKPLTP